MRLGVCRDTTTHTSGPCLGRLKRNLRNDESAMKANETLAANGCRATFAQDANGKTHASEQKLRHQKGRINTQPAT
jgi:hypothetical protein